MGSGDQAVIWFATTSREAAGGLDIRFGSPQTYFLKDCQYSADVFSTAPSSNLIYKTWRITLTKTAGVRLVIHCNNEKVLDIVSSSSICGKTVWSTAWNRDIGMIKFPSSWDSASDYYRPGTVSLNYNNKIPMNIIYGDTTVKVDNFHFIQILSNSI